MYKWYNEKIIKALIACCVLPCSISNAFAQMDDLEKIVSIQTHSINLVGTLKLSVRNYEGFIDIATGKYVEPNLDQCSKITLTTSGIVRSRLKIEYNPLYVVFQGANRPYVRSVENYAFDGKLFTTFVSEKQEAKTGRAVMMRQGNILACQNDELEEHYLRSGLLFNAANAGVILSGCTLRDVIKNPKIKVEKVLQADPKYPSCLGFKLREVESGEWSVLWLDADHQFALRHLEAMPASEPENKSTVSKVVIDARDFEQIGKSGFWYPKTAIQEIYEDGVMTNKQQVLVDSISELPSQTDDSYRISFPVGTSVIDERFGIRFKVGNDAVNSLRQINKYADPEQKP